MEKQLLALIIAVATLEAVLILAGVLPPVASYSPGNLLFLLARATVVVYAGWQIAKPSLQAAATGATLALASYIIMILAVLTGYFMQKPVLGINIPQTQHYATSLALVLLVNALLNMLLGAVASVLAAFLAHKFSKPKEEKKSKKKIERKACAP